MAEVKNPDLIDEIIIFGSHLTRITKKSEISSILITFIANLLKTLLLTKKLCVVVFWKINQGKINQVSHHIANGIATFFVLIENLFINQFCNTINNNITFSLETDTFKLFLWFFLLLIIVTY